ncbi:MAG: hypothetical protein ABIG03_06035 [Candidatus Eisenbacteria bacterium]
MWRLAGLALLCVSSALGLVTASEADGALTWQQLGPDTEVNVVAVAPATGDTILVSAFEAYDRQVYRTDDAGQIWEPVPGLAGIHDIVIDPRHPLRMYAVGGPVFRSLDGGVTWEATTTDIDAAIIAIDPACGRRLFAGSEWCDPFTGRVYRSSDWGATWVDIGPEPPLGHMEWVSDIVVDPSDSNVIYFSTFDHEFGGTGVYKTPDGGATWECLGWPGEIGQAAGQILYVSRLHISEDDPDRLIAGSGVFNFGVSGAIYETADGGTDWNTLAVSGIPDITYLTTLAFEPLVRRRDTVFLGAGRYGGPDWISYSLDSGRGWHTLVEGLEDMDHGFDIATDDSLRVYYTTGSGVVRSSVPRDPRVAYSGHAVDDSAGGDGDGHIDPGETVSLDVELRNLFGLASGVSAVLSSDDVFINVTQPFSEFPDLTWGESASSTTSYEFSVAPTRPPGPVEFALEVTAGGFYDTETFYLDPGILLVDDDDFDEYEAVYEQALEENHLAYRTWNIVPEGPVTGDLLAESDVVIWFSSAMAPGVRGTILSPEEEDLLSQYLDGGGRLFLSSQDYSAQWHAGSSQFAMDYLHVDRYFEDRSYSAVEGVDGDPIGDGLMFDPLDYPFPNLSDSVFPDSLAARVMNVTPGIAAAAIRYPSVADSAPFRTVFLAFPFEAVPLGGEPPGTRGTLLRRIVEWLVPEGGLVPTGVAENSGPPEGFGDLSLACHPNPACGPVSLKINPAGFRGEVRVAVYTVDGGLVWRSGIGQAASRDRVAVTWDHCDQDGQPVSSGVYFVRASVGAERVCAKLVVLR